MEEVNLKELQTRLRGEKLPLWRRGLPTFLIALVLLDAASMVIGHPGLAGILSGRPKGIAQPSALASLLIFHGGLLAVAAYFRSDSPLMGILSDHHADGGLSPVRLFALARGEGELSNETRRRHKAFNLAFAFLVLLALPVLASGERSLIWLPLNALAWAVTAASLATVGMILWYHRTGHPEVGLSLAAAAALSLLFQLPSEVIVVESIAAILIQLAIVGAALACLAYLLIGDVTGERTYCLVSSDNSPGGVYKCPLDGSVRVRTFLTFALNEASPVLVFARSAGEAEFRQMPVSSAAPVPVHNTELWIFNFGRLLDTLPEVELVGGEYFLCKASITRVIRVGAISDGADLTEAALDAAAQNIFGPTFATTLHSTLVRAFSEQVRGAIQKLDKITSDVRTLYTELVSLPDGAPRDAAAWPAQMTLEQIKARLKKLEADSSASLNQAGMLSPEWATRLTAEWLAQLEKGLCDETRGVRLDLGQARFIVALLGLHVTIVKRDAGPGAETLRTEFDTVRNKLNDRFESARAHQRRLDEIKLDKILSDPIGIMQALQDPAIVSSIGGGIPSSDAWPSEPPKAITSPSAARRRVARKKK